MYTHSFSGCMYMYHKRKPSTPPDLLHTIEMQSCYKHDLNKTCSYCWFTVINTYGLFAKREKYQVRNISRFPCENSTSFTTNIICVLLIDIIWKVVNHRKWLFINWNRTGYSSLSSTFWYQTEYVCVWLLEIVKQVFESVVYFSILE